MIKIDVQIITPEQAFEISRVTMDSKNSTRYKNIIEEIGKSIQYSCEEGEFDTIIINDNILDINDVDFILDFLNNMGYEARLMNEDKDKSEYPYSIFISWVHGNEKNKKK